ncbi:uncharacterized protein DNG_03899 [Cephalotrichum gorgonifer]|uniref:C2H2-type domain-containing protein n=1 Tax=Cephalotrichum gorgonifer TaxID=2041049 RepID=A0AAE8MXV0_9PEZI|nr:uncharacterized protein DNG_03899 [Cephalotrichum gorgonifer]
MSKRSRGEETQDLSEPPAKRTATRSSRESSSTPEPSQPPKKFLCPHPGCDKLFSRPSRLAIHERSHTGERPFACTHDGCSKSYMEEKHLAQHITDTHTGERNYPCEVDGCGAAFSTGTRLRRHQATVHADDKAGFRCAGHGPCTKSFRKRSALERHVRKDHLGLSPYACPEENCGAAYDSAGALRNHKEREHGELKFWCEVCGQDGSSPRVGFTIQSQLQNHMRKQHLDCVFCEFTSSSRNDLARHVEMQHADRTVAPEKPRIQCTWDGCDSWFTKKSNLNVHIRCVHEGKRFVCGEFDLGGAGQFAAWDGTAGCGKGFASKANLEDHVRYVHLGLPRPPNTRRRRGTTVEPVDEVSGALDASKRNLDCPVEGCDLRFIRHLDLVQHMETHQEAPQHLDAPQHLQTYPDLDPHLHLGTSGPGEFQAAQDASFGVFAGPFVAAQQQPFADTGTLYPGGGEAYGSMDMGPGDVFLDPSLQYALQDPHSSHTTSTRPSSEPVSMDAFAAGIAMENAEFAQQLAAAAAEDGAMPAWDNSRGTLVEA